MSAPRLLGLAGLAFLTVGNAGCGNSETPRNPDTGPAPRGRLRVSHGSLLDGDGHRLVLRGVGLGAIYSVKGMGRWDEAHFANARAWGAELVRVPVFPFTFRQDREQTLRDLDDALAWAERQSLYLIIDYHVMGNASAGQFLYEEFITWEEAADFWTTVATRYADRPTVAFAEIYNEPAALDPVAGAWEWSNWRQHADVLVATVRASAPKMIPVVAGLDFAYDFSAGGDQPFSDPDIALSAHPYPGKARASRRAAWTANFGYLSDRYPVILTEIGFDPEGDGGYRDDLSYGREIVNYADERSMSWTAFVFHNEEGWPMPLFTDWDALTPTLSGQFFKDVLAGTPLESAGSNLVSATVDAGSTAIAPTTTQVDSE